MSSVYSMHQFRDYFDLTLASGTNIVFVRLDTGISRACVG